MNYLSWNNILSEHFFNPEMAGRRVYLFVTKELIEELGQPQNADLQDFISAIKDGPSCATRNHICQKALKAFKNWRSKGFDYPPYMAYLAFFVLAAGIEGDYSPIAYYPRLRELLGEEPRAGQFPSFDKMIELWEDLEHWANIDKHGDLGIFSAFFPVNWIHVALPLSQALFSEHERKLLPVIFADAGLEPTLPPSDDELLNLITEYGGGRLRPKTLKMLRSHDKNDEELRKLITEIIVEDLQEWDGTIPDELMGRDQVPQNYGLLVLCGKLDRVAGSIEVFIRCKSKHEFPEGGFYLSGLSRVDVIHCEGSVMGWSTCFQHLSGNEFNASNLDWMQDITVKESELGWKFKFPGSGTRIFVSGAPYGLPNLVEIYQMPSNMQFYLAVAGQYIQLIRHWGESGCKGFKEINISSGLPDGWHLFRIDAVVNDELVKSVFRKLSLPKSTRINFEGGLKISSGNKYFAFAPPHITVQCLNDEVEVLYGDMPLQKDGNRFCLPEHLQPSNKFTVEARKSGFMVARRTLHLVRFFPWPEKSAIKWVDSFGRISVPPIDLIAKAAGALVCNVEVPDFPFTAFIELSEYQRVVFVGSSPGQVADWPTEPRPTEWSPVWAIPMRRRQGFAAFCGMKITDAEPKRGVCSDKKKVRQWKEVLWYWRKRIKPPNQEMLRKLWIKLQDEAHRVS